MKAGLNNNDSNLHKYGALMLAVWLLSLFIHISHVQEEYVETLSQKEFQSGFQNEPQSESQSEVQVDCKLCQKSYDKPQGSLPKAPASYGVYTYKTHTHSVLADLSGTHFTPPLRAPPVLTVSLVLSPIVLKRNRVSNKALLAYKYYSIRVYSCKQEKRWSR